MAKLKAAIFDLDGVVTQTASTHAKAWEEMFADYNQQRKKEGKEPYRDFSIDDDYPEYLDGMPRYDGVENFLKSRNIELPYGTPEDPPERESICGLGNRKNKIFQRLLEGAEVEIYRDNVEVIREWKASGVKTAVISSSKNCEKILKATELEDLFEVRIDGVVSAKRQLRGKPAPDIFLEAAKELQVEPGEALVVEDAFAGVEAAKKGGFYFVIGIGTNEEDMKRKGADQVVQSLKEVKLYDSPSKHFDHLPSALQCFEEIGEKIKNCPVILCLDYDGTLTPIVERYDQAVISDDMRALVKKLTDKLPVAIISGRDVSFIRKHVDLEGVYYAGSHGFEIVGPEGFHYEMEEAESLLPLLDDLEEELRDQFVNGTGVEIERKKYAIAVHYRNADGDTVPELKEKIKSLLEKSGKLKTSKGKMVVEIRPAIDWDKGKAVQLISERIKVEGRESAAVYVGDDVTDEDAFRVITKGAGIIVGRHEDPTAADYQLKDVDEVRQFLDLLSKKL